MCALYGCSEMCTILMWYAIFLCYLSTAVNEKTKKWKKLWQNIPVCIKNDKKVTTGMKN